MPIILKNLLVGFMDYADKILKKVKEQKNLPLKAYSAMPGEALKNPNNKHCHNNLLLYCPFYCIA